MLLAPTKRPPERLAKPMVGKGWRRKFDDPIELPDGRVLVTLRDAATYITELPKKESAALEWQIAISELMLAVERNPPTMLARIGFMQALNRHKVRESSRGRGSNLCSACTARARGSASISAGARCRARRSRIPGTSPQDSDNRR